MNDLVTKLDNLSLEVDTAANKIASTFAGTNE